MYKRPLLWAAACVPAAVILVLLAWLKHEPARAFDTRERDGSKEVIVEGRWYPLVTSTRSPLLRFVPPELTPGPVAHLNADGTAIITSHVEAGRRSGWDGVTPGYPKPD